MQQPRSERAARVWVWGRGAGEHRSGRFSPGILQPQRPAPCYWTHDWTAREAEGVASHCLLREDAPVQSEVACTPGTLGAQQSVWVVDASRRW